MHALTYSEPPALLTLNCWHEPFTTNLDMFSCSPGPSVPYNLSTKNTYYVNFVDQHNFSFSRFLVPICVTKIKLPWPPTSTFMGVWTPFCSRLHQRHLTNDFFARMSSSAFIGFCVSTIGVEIDRLIGLCITMPQSSRFLPVLLAVCLDKWPRMTISTLNEYISPTETIGSVACNQLGISAVALTFVWHSRFKICPCREFLARFTSKAKADRYKSSPMLSLSVMTSRTFPVYFVCCPGNAKDVFKRAFI